MTDRELLEPCPYCLPIVGPVLARKFQYARRAIVLAAAEIGREK